MDMQSTLLTEPMDIVNRWKEYTEELYKEDDPGESCSDNIEDTKPITKDESERRSWSTSTLLCAFEVNMYSFCRLLHIRVSASINMRKKHVLPDLSYDYGDLEPVLSAEIMKLHHQKHHAAYVNNLNIAEEKIHEALVKGDVSSAISNVASLHFNGGGHINHSILWKTLAKDGGEPCTELMDAMKRDFGSFERMKEIMSAATVAVQGSGWGWLGYDKKSDQLRITTCFNQDTLEAYTGLVPLFGVDVWEHAYYLQYKNLRADYVKEIWKIANWNDINLRYRNAIQK